MAVVKAKKGTVSARNEGRACGGDTHFLRAVLEDRVELVFAQRVVLRRVLRDALRAEVRLRRVHLVDDCARVNFAIPPRRAARLTGVLEHHLLLRTLQHVLLHRVLAHEPVDTDMGLLADTMSTSHSLQIVLRVPVALSRRMSITISGEGQNEMTHVKDNDRVRSLKIDTQPTSSCREQERKIWTGRCVEMGDALLPHFTADGTIKPLMSVSA